MSEASPPIPELVAVECPVCYTRMHARPAKAPGQIKCPDCYTLARVPSISEVRARLPRRRAAEAVGSYDLGSPTNPTVDDTRDWPTAGSYDLRPAAAEPRDVSAPRISIPAPYPPTTAAPPTEARQAAPSASPHASGPRAKPRETSGSPARPTPAQPADAPAPAVTVSCPACGAQIEPPLSDEPQTILCPDCLEDVPVPARRDLLARSRPRPTPTHGSAPPHEVGPVRDQASSRRAAAPGHADPAARLAASPQPRRSRRETPHEPDAPAPEPAAGRRSTANADDDERIEFAAVVYPEPPTKPVNVFDAMAEIRQAPVDPPGQWTFFGSVLAFPWRRDMLLKWVFLTLGFTAFGVLLCGFVILAQELSWLLVVVFLMPGFVAAAGLTLSYAAACFLPILIDTAAGNDRVTSWFDPNWKEWAVQFMYLVCMMLTAGLFGHIAGEIGERAGGQYGLVLGVTVFLTFPIVVLSTQEANSPFIPLSLPILKSLVAFAGGWLLFYALSGLVVGAAAALIALEASVSPYFALLGSGPILATVFLIYPRLLGRLAWRASLAKPRRRKRRRQPELPAPAGGVKSG